MIPALESFDTKGTEHTVRFRGSHVEKHQHSDGWTAFLDDRGLLGIRRALPTEYLSRLDDHNEFFGDQIRIIGLTRANRFVTIQPTLRGGMKQKIGYSWMHESPISKKRRSAFFQLIW